MKFKLSIISLFLLINYSLYAYELAICAIFCDDARYLSEWIEFHLNQGVEHFYLYDNLSRDNPMLYLKKYEKVITYIPWFKSYNDLRQWNDIQCSSYMDCIKNFAIENKWVAFIDTDEFLFCPKGGKLTEFLKENENFPAIGVNWIIYGTSNLNVPAGEKLTDYLVWRAPTEYDGEKQGNRHIKTIAQVKYVKKIDNPHFCFLHNQMQSADENGNPIHEARSDYVSVNKIRINHYWSRDLIFFYSIKLPRRLRWGNDWDNQVQIEKELNAVYDPILSSLK